MNRYHVVLISFVLLASQQQSQADGNKDHALPALQLSVERSFADRGHIGTLEAQVNADACIALMEVMQPVHGVVHRYHFDVRSYETDSSDMMVVCVNYEASGSVSREYFPLSVFDHLDQQTNHH